MICIHKTNIESYTLRGEKLFSWAVFTLDVKSDLIQIYSDYGNCAYNFHTKDFKEFLTALNHDYLESKFFGQPKEVNVEKTIKSLKRIILSNYKENDYRRFKRYFKEFWKSGEFMMLSEILHQDGESAFYVYLEELLNEYPCIFEYIDLSDISIFHEYSFLQKTITRTIFPEFQKILKSELED